MAEETLAFCSKERVSIFGPTSIWALNIWSLAMTIFFLAGVVFFVHRLSDVVVYVSLFALGHTLTLISGVFFDFPANVYLVDAVIRISVIYKAAENLGALESIGLKIDPKAAVFDLV